MISQEQVIKIANQLQTTELNVLREYFQHVFLSYFYQQPQTNNIYFKGGTALRFVHRSSRFSEDLDFSANLSKTEIEKALTLTLAEIEKEGIPIDLQEAKTTTGGYLSILVFQKDPNIAIQIETSLRDDGKRGESATIVNDFIPTYTVLVLRQDQLIEQKIEALLTRKKPRDFYDIYFILRANLLLPKKKDILPQILAALHQTDINFENELKEFLPKTHWAIIRDFKSSLEREIKRFKF